MRSLASEIFAKIYCVATYPTPSIPSPIAMGVLFRRNHRRVAEIMTQFEDLYIHTMSYKEGVGEEKRYGRLLFGQELPCRSSLTRLGMFVAGLAE